MDDDFALRLPKYGSEWVCRAFSFIAGPDDASIAAIMRLVRLLPIQDDLMRLDKVTTKYLLSLLECE